MTARHEYPPIMTSPYLLLECRTLRDVRLKLADRRLDLLLRQANALAEARECDRELYAVERRLEMIESAEVER